MSGASPLTGCPTSRPKAAVGLATPRSTTAPPASGNQARSDPTTPGSPKTFSLRRLSGIESSRTSWKRFPDNASGAGVRKGKSEAGLDAGAEKMLFTTT